MKGKQIIFNNSMEIKSRSDLSKFQSVNLDKSLKQYSINLILKKISDMSFL